MSLFLGMNILVFCSGIAEGDVAENRTNVEQKYLALLRAVRINIGHAWQACNRRIATEGC